MGYTIKRDLRVGFVRGAARVKTFFLNQLFRIDLVRILKTKGKRKREKGNIINIL